MNSTAKHFEDNRYVYIPQLVTQQECKELTDYMFTLEKEGKLEKDPQCPLSGAVYGDKLFDNLLERLVEPLSRHLEIDLLPTYTYARLYKPGEVLERHSDRPSCEISGTMTLGFDPNTGVWPIFFGKDKDDHVGHAVSINPGDLVMYRGTELPHWRPTFKGDWQVQVFFHYVDAKGPYKDHKYDNRESLGLPKPIDKPEGRLIQFSYFNQGRLIGLQDGVNPLPIGFCSTFNPDLAFTPEECERIKNIGRGSHPTKASIGDESNSKVDTSVRSVNQYEISLHDESNGWIFDKIGFAVAVANTEYFKFNLLGIIHHIELLQYTDTDKGHYDWHVDIGGESAATRKISVSVPLSNFSDYEGGVLEFNNGGSNIPAIDEQGAICMFPSYMLHRVTPVTKGERWVMVLWIHGSDRFK
ncbi:MAG TPA: hypothetical protein DCY51_05360 [Bacteroidetes bacterium]|nr:hypothetical protein [Bacteroidota bacterium]